MRVFRLERRAEAERRRHAAAAALALCVGAAFVLRAPAFGLPVDRDSAVYASIGRWLTDGALPYRDLIDHKQPAVYPLYAALEAVAPGSAHAIHAASALVAALGAWLLFLALRGAVGTRLAGAAAALATIVGASRYVEGFGLNTEHLLLVTGTIPIALALALPPSGRRAWPALIGVAFAVAVLTKAVVALVAPAVLLALVLRRSAGERTRDLATFAAGGAAVLAVLAGVYAAAGAAGDLFTWNVAYNAEYASQLRLADRVERLRMYPADLLLIASATVAAVVALRRRGIRDPLAATLSAWLAGATAGMLLGGFGYAHYYLPIVPSAAALLALAAAPAVGGRRGAQARRADRPAGRPATAMAAVAALALAPFAVDHARALIGGSDWLAARAYGAQAAVWRAYAPVGRTLRARAEPRDRLYVAGNEAGFYWQSRLRPASRLLYDAPLALRPELAREFARAVCERPPRFVVLAHGALPAHASCLAGAGYAVLARHAPAVVVLER